MSLKKHVVKVLVWSTVLYGSKSWTLQKNEIKRLEAFEMWIWRRMLKTSWTKHKTNDEVLQCAEEQRTLRQRQKNGWDVLRHDSLLTQAIEAQVQGRKKPGRPREILDWLMKKRIQNQNG